MIISLHGSILVWCWGFFFNFKNDVEIPIPKFFINERYDVLKEREKLLGKILAKIGPQEKEDVSILAIRSTNWILK